MFFSRIASFFVLGLAATTFASPVAQPAPEVDALAVRQSEASVEAVFTNLKTTLDPLLSQINTMKTSKTATSANVQPIMNSITSALNNANTQLDAIPDSAHKRQSTAVLAALIAGIVSDLVNTLDGVVIGLSFLPILGPLLTPIDFALAKLLHSVEGLVGGVLFVVAGLLGKVTGLLSALAFDLTLASLGL